MLGFKLLCERLGKATQAEDLSAIRPQRILVVHDVPFDFAGTTVVVGDFANVTLNFESLGLGCGVHDGIIS